MADKKRAMKNFFSSFQFKTSYGENFVEPEAQIDNVV